jgi:hypothetical protein
VVAASLTLVLVAGLVWAPTTSAGDRAGGLYRPLDLPEVAPGQDCPVSPVDERVDWDSINIFGGSGTGPGPVYPGIGGSDPPGHVTTTRDHADETWFGTKVFWYVKPSYRGPALIRGRRLDGAGTLRFQARDPRPRPELRIRRNEEVSWDGQPRGSRGRPSGILVRSPGCYGVQIDGTRFSRTVVFSVSTD